MNKIEKVLDKLIENAKKFNNNEPDGFIFIFNYEAEGEIQFFFNLEENLPNLYLNFIKVREDGNNQFNFNLPIEYVSTFVDKHLNNKKYLKEFKYLKENDPIKIDNIYNQLLNKISDNSNFIPIIFPAILDNEISNKEQTEKKKLKI